jgi:pantothenate synthetase|nr:MAG TPA: hypothetical protein [Caudoviricetes sp.]
MEIDENVIYKKAFETMMDVEDWCFESNVSGKEVGNFIDGVTTLATKLLKIVKEKVIAEED